MRPLIVANWKMNLVSEQVVQLIEAIKESDKVDVLICPAFPYLGLVSHMLAAKQIKLGAQDCHDQARGAYTGCVSAEMLKDMGCEYVIVGHSERRQQYAESNELVSKKAEAALQAGLTPIICIGETEDENKSGKTKSVLKKQIHESLPRNGNVVLAYEPVWAIGTGRTPTLDDISEVHSFISAELKERGGEFKDTPLLYGGSVNEKNTHEVLRCSNVDGALVGGASLKAEAFNEIIQAAQFKD